MTKSKSPPAAKDCASSAPKPAATKPPIKLTDAQAKAVYTQTGKHEGNKPVFIVPAKQMINPHSGFKEKGLCDGPTLALGLACGFSCRYCYVPAQLGLHPAINRIKKETGLNFEEITIRRSYEA